MKAKPAVLLAALAMVGTSPAQNLKVEKYRLPNGLTVILHEDHTVPLATINTWFYVGSKDEPDRRSGFAHLFEHLMFMGTERVPNNQFDTTMEEFGGQNNASTAEDRTNYYSFGPSNLLKTLLWLDADRLEDLGRTMDQKKLDLQREVVRNERRQNTELQPYGEAYESLNGLLFPKGHPYHTSVIGSHEDLQNAQVQDVKDFFATYYVPNNASLVVAGDFNPKDIKPYIAQVFGTLPRRNDPPRKDLTPAKLTSIKRVTMTDQVQNSKTIMAWLSPAAYKKGDAEMSLAASILAGGVSSRLYQRLVVELKLATEVSSFQNSLYLGSYFVIDATAAEGVSQDKLEKAIDTTLHEFVQKGPTADEVKRQAANTQMRIVSGLQSLARKADKLNEYQFYFGEPNSFQREIDLYRNQTPESVRAVAAQVLNPQARLILRVVPRQDESTRAARDTKPVVGKDRPFKAPSGTDFTLANGLKVSYWYRPELPLMNLTTVVDYGADHDPATKAGRASLVADMLTSGSGSRNAKQFEDALSQLGASVSASAGRTHTSVSAQSLTANFPQTMALYVDALTRPSFLATEWDRLHRITLNDLKEQQDDADTVANVVTFREYFGAAHPESRPVSGTLATVGKVSLADVKQAFAQGFSPANARVFAAGSMKPGDLKALLGKTLGTWSGKAKLAAPTYPAVPASDLRVMIVDKPSAPQTVISFAMPAPSFSDPNRIALEALGTILGGTFTSRLNQNLREKNGYTYGASSDFVFERAYGLLSSGASVRADATGASLREFLSEFAKIRTGDISEAEAKKARSTIRANAINSFSSLGRLVGSAVDLNNHGQSFADLVSELAKLEGLTSEQLNSLAKTGVPLEHGLLVLVGDKTLILEQLKGTGLPTPTVVKF